MARAITKYIRIPPRKARLMADVIRGMKVDAATVQLTLSPMKAGKLLKKTLDSAVANAETQLNVQRRDLFVKEVRVDAGPVLKRAKSKSRGGRAPVMKRTSHFTIVVAAE
ncbi:MAG: 50S ribosomal protein L22 [Chlamydiales bacterium]|nr:50S ribosomal protein L22 [Chlamydiales bacterium]